MYDFISEELVSMEAVILSVPIPLSSIPCSISEELVSMEVAPQNIGGSIVAAVSFQKN